MINNANGCITLAHSQHQYSHFFILQSRFAQYGKHLMLGYGDEEFSDKEK